MSLDAIEQNMFVLLYADYRKSTVKLISSICKHDS